MALVSRIQTKEAIKNCVAVWDIVVRSNVLLPSDILSSKEGKKKDVTKIQFVTSVKCQLIPLIFQMRQ